MKFHTLITFIADTSFMFECIVRFEIHVCAVCISGEYSDKQSLLRYCGHSTEPGRRQVVSCKHCKHGGWRRPTETKISVAS